MMGGGNGVLWYLVLTALLVIPFWKILPRYGIAAPFALFAVLPVGAIILLWIIAFRDKFSDRAGV
ncbi:hypothetical protein [Tranquillimonas rosea]|uniref:hypothetical protein n=1 Tax=Tranquillimonas rosea TaxID=641238 RepID=UPI003BA8758C